MQVIYSTTPVENAEGRKVKNPRHFVKPIEGATKVYLNGDYPTIKASYEEAKVSVADISEMRALPKSSRAEPAAAEAKS